MSPAQTKKMEGVCAVIDPRHTAATALPGNKPYSHKSPSHKEYL
jgi:hypothetical protein